MSFLKKPLFGTLILAVCAAPTSAAFPKEQCLTLRSLKIDDGQFVDGLKIEGKNATIVSLQAMLPGWSATITNDISGNSAFSGASTGGVANVDAQHLDALPAIIFERSDADAGNVIFTGKVSIGKYGEEPPLHSKEIVLTTGNFFVSDKNSCLTKKLGR